MTTSNQKKNNPLDEFLYLWKSDDKEWMKERKRHWKILKEENFKDFTQRELSLYRKYFLHGLKEGWIDPIILFMLTPIDSAATAKMFFDSGIIFGDDKRRLMSEFVLDSPKWSHSMPWQRIQMMYFVEGILGKEYVIIKENNATLSPEPSRWCAVYSSMLLKYLKGEYNYHGCVDSFSYFLSALGFASDIKRLESIKQKINEAINIASNFEVNPSVEDKLRKDFCECLLDNKEKVLQIIENKL